MGYIGEISALATAVCWSFTAYAFTDASRRVGSVQVNIDRMFLASVILLIIIFAFGINLNLTFYQIGNLILSGVVGLVLGDSFLFKSFQLIGARIGMILMALVPVISTVLAVFFLDEIIALTGLFGMLLTISGILLVVFEKNQEGKNNLSADKLGILYGILGALGQASGLIFAKFAFQAGELNGFSASFIRLSSSTIILFPVIIFFRKYKNPLKLYKINPKAIKSVLIGTTFGPVAGITLSLVAIANTKVGIASTLMAMMPIIMLPIAKYYFKEKINWKAVVGAFVAVAGAAIIFLR